jgi:hypothetical protein
MQKIFWKTKKGKIVSGSEVRFKTEDELERFIQENAKQIWPETFILHRQIRAGRDIPDMVGVDRENCAVIIENKNVPVDEEILPQIMRYAVWAETHQDTIRVWCQEAEEDLPKIDWEQLKIRLVVIAPSIKSTVPRLVKKLGYLVDLIEIKKFVVGTDEIIFVNQLELPAEEGRAIAKGMPTYDREFYKEQRNPRSVDAFFALTSKLETIVKREGWALELKFNANYAGFKHGFFNVFGVAWGGTKSFGVFAKIPKNKFSKAKRLSPYPSEYDERWKQIWIPATENLKPEKLIPVIQLAHDLLVGESVKS